MKKSFKLLLVTLMLALIFSLSATVAFAADTADEENPVVDTYTDENGNLIVVLKDGTKYNLGEQEIVTDKKEESGIDISFNSKRLVYSLQYMWKGMLCIFIVIGALILVVYGLNKSVNYLADRKSATSSDSE